MTFKCSLASFAIVALLAVPGSAAGQELEPRQLTLDDFNRAVATFLSSERADLRLVALFTILEFLRDVPPEVMPAPDRDYRLAAATAELAKLLQMILPGAEGTSRAVALVEDTLGRVAPETEPWGRLHLLRAETLSAMPEGAAPPDRYQPIVESLEKAALVFTKADYPEQWALIAFNLGQMNAMRGDGDVRAHREAALDYTLNALTVRTRDVDPVNWAITQSGLAFVLVER